MFLGGLDGRAPVDDADGARDANFRAAGDVFDDWSDNRTDGAEDGALAMGGGVIELEVILKYDAIDPLFKNDYITIIILQTRMALLNLLHVIRTQFKKSRRGCPSTKQSSRSGTSEHLAVGTSSERHLPMTPTPGWRQTCLDSSEMVKLMAGACKIDNKCIQFFDPELL